MNMFKFLYFSNPPGDIDAESAESIHGHFIVENEGTKVIWPERFDADHVSPETILALKKELKIDKILFIDKIKNVEGKVNIEGHINRSGLNFLRAKTPYQTLPRFPDMSRIYNLIPNLPKVTVHTVGPERFKAAETGKEIWSETAGIIAPVLHYCGLNVCAIGTTSPDWAQFRQMELERSDSSIE